MGKIKTYREEFPVGTRVKVVAGPAEGTDHEFNGRAGTIVEYGQFIAVELDRPPKYWRNPCLISPSNLRHTKR